MLRRDFRLINEEFYADLVLPEKMDSLWANGWRHFGTHFFRYNVGFFRDELRLVIPLRIDLSRFSFSKSQRRNLRRNSDLRVEVRPIRVNESVMSLFNRHKTRFSYGTPESIYNFISRKPAVSPCEAKETVVYLDETPVAISYFDVGGDATSGVYAMFEPTITDRGLGIFTLLKEVEYAIETGRRYYYLGYAYEGSSFYDYKKRFRATEAFDWMKEWKSFANLLD
jgi:leucyl-tRNA---protein transferase